MEDNAGAASLESSAHLLVVPKPSTTATTQIDEAGGAECSGRSNHHHLLRTGSVRMPKSATDGMRMETGDSVE